MKTNQLLNEKAKLIKNYLINSGSTEYSKHRIYSLFHTYKDELEERIYPLLIKLFIEDGYEVSISAQGFSFKLSEKKIIELSKTVKITNDSYKVAKVCYIEEIIGEFSQNHICSLIKNHYYNKL